MVEGALLVIFVIWLFLRAIKGSFAVAVTIPLALLVSFVGLTFAGVPANLLSMGTVDFGILLDGAVILVENVYSHLTLIKWKASGKVAERNPQGKRKWCGRSSSACRSMHLRLMLPDLRSGKRVEGASSLHIGKTTYAFALVGALLFTLTVVPALTTVLLKDGKVKEEEQATIFLRRYLGLRVAASFPPGAAQAS